MDIFVVCFLIGVFSASFIFGVFAYFVYRQVKSVATCLIKTSESIDDSVNIAYVDIAHAASEIREYITKKETL